MLILIILTWIFIALCVYVYLGYPLLLTILAKIWQRPVDKAAITPSVSLIIAAYDEEDVIGEKAENSLKLNYPQ